MKPEMPKIIQIALIPPFEGNYTSIIALTDTGGFFETVLYPEGPSEWTKINIPPIPENPPLTNAKT